MPIFETFAPAKINLALHVTGQRADGYHLLDTLVSFAPVGDLVTLERGPLSLKVSGPEARGVPEDGRNLVAKAVYHHAETCGFDGAVTMQLLKNLPAASGIGGGSSDAAAALRGMIALYDTPELWCREGRLALAAHEDAMEQLAILDLAALGADLPMCFVPAPARVRGIGEILEPVSLPDLPAVLVNPRVEVPTPTVFKGLIEKTNPPMGEIPAGLDTVSCIDWLAHLRNDLQAPAVAAAPVIGAVLAALGEAPLARMSGSGATCFALYASEAEAEQAASALRKARPDWWVAAALLGDQTARSAPRQRSRATT